MKMITMNIIIELAMLIHSSRLGADYISIDNKNSRFDN